MLRGPYVLLSVCSPALGARAVPPRCYGVFASIVISRALPAGVPPPNDGGKYLCADYLCTRQLTHLAISSFYGEGSPWDGPVAYMQRAIINQDVQDDLAKRLRYYEEARGRGLRHIGAIYVAADEDTGDILGFVDVGLALYHSRKRIFRLPQRPEGEPGYGTKAGAHLTCRPYLSNLAVSTEQRRRGVGKLLVAACEREVTRWHVREHVNEDHADGHLGDRDESMNPAEEHCSSLWLEVSRDNQPALLFYRRLGYEFVSETSGKEIVKKRWAFESEMVQRYVMRKQPERSASELP